MKTKKILLDVGNRVAVERVLKGWSQQDLADRTGYSRASIANLEAGRQDMPISGVERIAKAFRIKLCTLFY